MKRSIVISSIHFEDPSIRAEMDCHFVVFGTVKPGCDLLEDENRVLLPVKNSVPTLGIVKSVECLTSGETYIIGFTCPKDLLIDLKEGDVLSALDT